MAIKMLKPCNKIGCNELSYNAYCEKHNSVKEKRKPQSTDGFYRTQDWKKTSKQYRAYKPNCEICGKPARLVHHKTTLKQLLSKGLDGCDWQYLQSVCWSCHEKVTHRGVKS